MRVLILVLCVVVAGCGETKWECRDVGKLQKIHYGDPNVVVTDSGVYAVRYGVPSGGFGEQVQVCTSDDRSNLDKLVIGGKRFSM